MSDITPYVGSITSGDVNWMWKQQLQQRPLQGITVDKPHPQSYKPYLPLPSQVPPESGAGMGNCPWHQTVQKWASEEVARLNQELCTGTTELTRIHRWEPLPKGLEECQTCGKVREIVYE